MTKTLKNSKVKLVLTVAVVVVLIWALKGMFMSGGPQGGADDFSGGAMPVTVIEVAPEDVEIWQEFSGRLEAVQFAEIKPQVGGIITDVRLEDGQNVLAGDILYVIDPRPYEAAMYMAQADVKAAEAQLNFASKEAVRARHLIKTEAVSKRLLDERNSQVNVANASVQAAKAALARAKIDLDYAFVKAPIAGRAGRAEVKRGNVVEAGPGAPLLTSVVSRETIYADFEIDDRTYLDYVRSGVRDRLGESQIPVEMQLTEDGEVYSGVIYSFDNQLDVTSGTIRARALFENADGALLPGMFASVRLGSAEAQSRIVVTEKAIGTDQARRFVYVVNDQNMVEYRQVQIGESLQGRRVIADGLNAGDKVIVEGIIRIRPGMPVKPMTADEMSSSVAEGA